MTFDIKKDGDIDLIKRAVAGKDIGLTSGSYDLFHHLHLVYLERCSRFCDILIVGVDSDDLVRTRKGPNRPLVPEHQRVAIVSGLSCVRAAFILGSINNFRLAVDILEPSIIFRNNDFKEKDVIGNDKAEIMIIPDLVQHSSTSEIIQEIERRRTSTKQVPQ